MENIIDFSKRRPASPTRSYVFTGAPFGESVSCSVRGPSGFQPVKEPAPPSAVATAAKLLARAILWARELTPRQKLEARLLKQTMLARSEPFQKLWQDKADLAALSITASIKPRPAFSITDRRTRPVTLWPWLLVGVTLAMAIAVTPAAWIGR